MQLMKTGPVLGATILAMACGPSQPATYPDANSVKGAQKAWCEMMAKTDGKALAGWRYERECLAAYPAGSSVYVERLADCYGKTVEDYGDDAPDSAAIIDTCTAEIMAGADPGDVSGTELYQARCARMERCDKLDATACASAWERVDPAARALLTSMYNLRAQAEIAACLRDADCGDEAAIEKACYGPVRDRLVWLPLSLEADPTLAPSVD